MNKAFFILVYSLCVVALLSGIYVKELSIAATIVFFITSFYLSLSISQHRKVVFYKQGIYYRDLFGASRYIPFEGVREIKIVAFFGIQVVQLNLTDSRRWFFAFNIEREHRESIQLIGYQFS
ncbi:hypothetical protein PALB_13450 [Pseudoalteromonas luteoviolacea B = ATCC 29581]|nr:hypothetical protein PALB_13450 [Pseudoalteromonas luteoviolacea B = ATCC 29581]